MSPILEPGNTIPVRKLLNENRWPLIAGEMACRQFYNIYNIIFMLSIYICVQGIPKFGLAIVKDGFVLDNVVAITLATRSVLWRMLTAGVIALPRSGSVESV